MFKKQNQTWKYCPDCMVSFSNTDTVCTKCGKSLVNSNGKTSGKMIYCESGQYIIKKQDVNHKPKVEYIPRCPLCQSPNIKQISAVKRAAHGYAFGLFSNTARSQWECLNCGNKF